MTAIGAILLSILGDFFEINASYVTPLGFFFVAMGSCGVIIFISLIHVDLFPVVFGTTTLGICNFCGRICCIFGPLVAEMPEPIPQYSLFTLSIIAVFVSLLIGEKS